MTCAEHFDYQFNQFLKNFVMSNAAPLGEIEDCFSRVEYQQRGSPLKEGEDITFDQLQSLINLNITQ